MSGKTEGVRILVQDVLQEKFSEPYSEHIIRDVCIAIENNTDWRRRYDELGEELRPWVVNNWIGKHTKDFVGMNSMRQVDLEDGHIITSYSNNTFAVYGGEYCDLV